MGLTRRQGRQPRSAAAASKGKGKAKGGRGGGGGNKKGGGGGARAGAGGGSGLRRRLAQDVYDYGSVRRRVDWCGRWGGWVGG